MYCECTQKTFVILMVEIVKNLNCLSICLSGWQGVVAVVVPDRQQQRVGSQPSRGRRRHFQAPPGGDQDGQGSTEGNKRLPDSTGGRQT